MRWQITILDSTTRHVVSDYLGYYAIVEYDYSGIPIPKYHVYLCDTPNDFSKLKVFGLCSQLAVILFHV